MLSVMTTCSMYDAAGEWLVSVGIPAKSGVSGGVLGVLPGRLGVAVFSPRLDEQGNSVRGVAVCRDLSQDLELHLIAAGERRPAAIRASYTLGERASKRRRSSRGQNAISAASARTAVFELQGDLDFMAAEAVSRSLLDRDVSAELVVVDLRRVERIDRAGASFLGSLADSLDAAGGALALSAAARLDTAEAALLLGDLDEALEWCENELLVRLAHEEEPETIDASLHPLLAGLDPRELSVVLARLGAVEAAADAVVVAQGENADELFLVTSGRLSVFAPGATHRLTTLTAGMTFGELAYVKRGPRTADVVADEPVTCSTLAFADLEELAAAEPLVYGKLLRNLLSVVTDSLHRANAELRHLAA